MTGGCGFIGTNLVQELLKRKAEVTVIDLPNGHWERLPRRVKRIKGNILKVGVLKGAFDNVDIVYHLAARTDLDGKKLIDYRVNFDGTENLINEIAKKQNSPRFVFYSTQLVVGLFNETRFIDENEPYKTKTIYGESKIAGEKVVKEQCANHKIAYTIIRPTSVYGPWGEAPYREFFYAIKRGRYFHVGEADNLVSWVYVKNLVDFTILSSLKHEAANQIYFGNDFHPYTMREIVDAVGNYYKIKIRTIPNVVITPIAYILGMFKLLGISVPIYPFRLKNIKASYCYDIQNSVAIGYLPKYSLQSGINETLEWYESKNYHF